jgi:hypothetical protein
LRSQYSLACVETVKLPLTDKKLVFEKLELILDIFSHNSERNTFFKVVSNITRILLKRHITNMISTLQSEGQKEATSQLK